MCLSFANSSGHVCRAEGRRQAAPLSAEGTLKRLPEEEEASEMQPWMTPLEAAAEEGVLEGLQCMRTEAAAWAERLSVLRQQDLPVSCAMSWVA